MTHPARLSWAQVTEALAVRLDVDALTRLALAHVPPAPPANREPVEAAIDVAFQRAHGGWASGWRWAHGEGSIGGGPVAPWCCPPHSVWRKGDTAAAQTARRAADALVDWRAWIAELAALFARSEPGLPAIVAFERHAAAVLAAVAERTGAEDAWYTHAHQVLTWFLESHGHDDADQIVTRAIAGRFESWVAPSETVAADVVAGLRDRVFRRRKAHVDGLALWTKARAATAWQTAMPALARANVDGVLDYIVRHDAAIDEERGARMLAALELARRDARGTAPLTFAMLQHWHGYVGEDPALRTHDAWAKDGRERYEHVKDLGDKVAAALRDANAGSSPIARAARVYLDICFLHPFANGNARAARLALDFVLTRAGLAVDDPDGALFRTPLAVTDPDLGTHYQTLVARLVVTK